MRADADSPVGVVQRQPPAHAEGPEARGRLRILWLSHFVPYPPTGGNLQRSYHLLRQAAGRHTIHLVALNMRAVLPTPEAVEEATYHLAEFTAEIAVFPNPWDRSSYRRRAMAALSVLHPRPYDQNWLYSPRLRAHLKSLAEQGRFDLIHVDTLGLMPYARLFRDVPVALNHHNVESQLARRRAAGESSVLHRLYFQWEATKLQRLERRVCPGVPVNLMVSELDAARLEGVAPGARTCVVDNGVDTVYFRPGVSGRPETGGLLFAGTLSWYPNLEAIRYFLADIWPALLADNPNRRMTFVGREPPAELQAAAADARISVTGRVADVRPYFDDASIYVCPIRDGGGTRLKILDALAMGKPVVATGLAVEGLDLAQDEHYLRAETAAEFVAQVRRLEGDIELRRRLGQAGRDLVVRRFAWEAVGRKLDAAYATAARTTPAQKRGAAP